MIKLRLFDKLRINFYCKNYVFLDLVVPGTESGRPPWDKLSSPYAKKRNTIQKKPKKQKTWHLEIILRVIMISETYLLTSNHLRTPLYFYCLMTGISFLWNFRSEDRQMHLLDIYINFLWRNMLWPTIMDLSQFEWDSRSKTLNNKKLKWLYYYWIYHERCKRRRQINKYT